MRVVGLGISRGWMVPLALNCAYIASSAVALAGLFVPFVQQGCPGNDPCLSLKLYLPHTTLAQGQDGLILLALVIAGLVLGLVGVFRLSTFLLVAKLLVSVATLAIACLDTVDPMRVLHLLNSFGLLVLAPGFVVVIIGSALATFFAVVHLALAKLPHRPRRSSARIVAA